MSEIENFDPAYHDRTIEDIKLSSGIENKETIKTLATNNFGFFLEHVLGLNTDSPLIKEAIRITNNPPDQPKNNGLKLAIMAPRGHSKTYSFTVAKALWIGYTETNKRIILTSQSRGQSKGILTKIKRIIERNELLHFLKPSKENREQLAESMDLKDDEGAWAAKSIVTTSDVAMVTKTFGSSIRSEHVDYVYCDDILSDESSGNMSKQQEKDTYYDVISPIAENKGGTIQVVGTPQSHNDLMMELTDKDSYYSSVYQAYDPETKEVLWPHIWTYDKLMNKKEEVGPARFAREYMVDPMSVEEQFFSWDEAVKPNLDTRYKQEHWRTQIDDSYEEWDFFVGVDIALSNSSGADYTVFQVLGRDPDGLTWHVDQRRHKGMTPDGIADKLEQLDDKYRFTSGLVEKNAIGEGVWDTISDKAQLSGRIKAFDTTRKTRPEILSRLQAALHSNKIILHDDDVLKEELLAFYRNDSGKLEGKAHDDTVMALAIAWKCAGAGGAVSSMTIIGEDGEEIKIDEDELDSNIDKVEIDNEELEGVGIV